MSRGATAAALVLAAAVPALFAADGSRAAAALELPCSPGRVYSTIATGPSPTAPAADAVRARWPHLEWAPELARAAALWGTAVAARPGAAASQSLVELALRAGGAPDASALATILGPADLDSALDELAPVVSAADPPFNRVGLTPAADGAGGGWSVVLVRRRFELEPVPARVPPGGSVRLRFTVSAGLDRPWMLVARPGQEPEKLEATRTEDTWAVGATLGGHGAAWLILEAEGPRGPEVLATLPVGVGEDPPCSWAPATVPATEPERRLLELVNLDRTRHGFPPLVPDDALAAVARDHSRDMAEADYFAHVSPTRGGLQARLAAHGLAVLAARENIAEAADADEAERSLMASPGHRANILAPEVTHLGVGAAPHPPHGLMFTQVLARPQELRDPARVTSLLRSELGSRADDRLDAVATTLARAAVAHRRLPPDALERARAALSEAGIGWSTLRLRYLEVKVPADASDLGLPGATRAGIGVAGPLAADSSRPWVVVLLTLR